MFAALRPDVLLRFRNRPDARKVLVNLIVEVFAIGDNYKRPVPRHLAQNLLRKENHRVTLAASLRVPKNSELPAIVANPVDCLECAADAKILMVLRDNRG